MSPSRARAAKPKLLEVVLDGLRAGQLTQDPNGHLAFVYEDKYRRTPDATPLSLSMLLSRAEHPHKVVDPFLRGLLPGSDAVLARWVRRFGVSANSPFTLLAHVGEDVAGAAQFVPPERLNEAMSPGKVGDIDSDYIAKRLRILRSHRSAWDDAHAPGQFSLAGAQSKFALYRSRSGRWGLPTGRQATTHILKPAPPDLADQDVNEHLCLVAAGHLGLPAARSEVVQFGDERAIVLRRYDRQLSSNGQAVRIHQEDFCQAMAIPPDRKYEREDGPGIAAMVELVRSVQSFTDALLLLSGAEVLPAPLYDISSVLPYPSTYNLRQMAMAMSVNGKFQNNLIRRDDGQAWPPGSISTPIRYSAGCAISRRGCPTPSSRPPAPTSTRSEGSRGAGTRRQRGPILAQARAIPVAASRRLPVLGALEVAVPWSASSCCTSCSFSSSSSCCSPWSRRRSRYRGPARFEASRLSLAVADRSGPRPEKRGPRFDPAPGHACGRIPGLQCSGARRSKIISRVVLFGGVLPNG